MLYGTQGRPLYSEVWHYSFVRYYLVKRLGEGKASTQRASLVRQIWMYGRQARMVPSRDQMYM